MENHQSENPIRRNDIWLADLPAAPESHVQSVLRSVIASRSSLDW